MCPPVFQSKVLQRLFPAAPKYESSRLQVENPSDPPCGKRKASRPSGTSAGLMKIKTVYIRTYKTNLLPLCSLVAAGETLSAEAPGRRLYTVLPPPADYKADSERSPTRFQLDGTSDKDAAGTLVVIIVHDQLSSTFSRWVICNETTLNVNSGLNKGSWVILKPSCRCLR